MGSDRESRNCKTACDRQRSVNKQKNCVLYAVRVIATRSNNKRTVGGGVLFAACAEAIKGRAAVITSWLKRQ
jgi:hypothetical protein